MLIDIVDEGESLPVSDPVLEALAPSVIDAVGVAEVDAATLCDAVGVTVAVGVPVGVPVDVGETLSETELVVLGVPEKLPVFDALAPSVSDVVGVSVDDALSDSVLVEDGVGVIVIDPVPEAVCVSDGDVDGVPLDVRVAVIVEDGEAGGVAVAVDAGVRDCDDDTDIESVPLGVLEQLSLFVLDPVGVNAANVVALDEGVAAMDRLELVDNVCDADTVADVVSVCDPEAVGVSDPV